VTSWTSTYGSPSAQIWWSVGALRLTGIDPTMISRCRSVRWLKGTFHLGFVGIGLKSLQLSIETRNCLALNLVDSPISGPNGACSIMGLLHFKIILRSASGEIWNGIQQILKQLQPSEQSRVERPDAIVDTSIHQTPRGGAPFCSHDSKLMQVADSTLLHSLRILSLSGSYDRSGMRD